MTSLKRQRIPWREPAVEPRDGDGWYVPNFDPEGEGDVAVGTDIIEIARIEKVYAEFGERFLRRVYTEREVIGIAVASTNSPPDLPPRKRPPRHLEQESLESTGEKWRFCQIAVVNLS